AGSARWRPRAHDRVAAGRERDHARRVRPACVFASAGASLDRPDGCAGHRARAGVLRRPEQAGRAGVGDAPGETSAGYPWSPAPAIRLSMLLHAAAAASLIAAPDFWIWALGAVLGNHLLLTLAVFWPRGRILGANLTRLPAVAAARREICLTFDDGPDPEVTSQVLDLLDRHQAKATFFCVGEKVAAHPGIVRDIERRGHGIENHSARHSNAFALYGPLRLKRE